MIKVLGLWTPVIVPFVLSGLLFFSAEKQNKPKQFLAAYMLLITFVFIANFFYFDHNYKIYSYVHSLHIASVLCIYPGAFVYIQLLLHPNIKWKKLAVHFLPAVLFFLASALIFYPLLNTSQRQYFLAEYRFHPNFSIFWLKMLYYIRMVNILALFIQVVSYPVFTYIALLKHKKAIRDIFSNPEKFQLNWLMMFNFALGLSTFICVFMYAVNPVKLFGDDRFLAYPLLMVALILWVFGVMGNNQKLIPLHDPISYGNDKSADDYSLLKEKLLTYFRVDKPYLNSELKIWDVARALGTNRTYISQLINSAFCINFSGFVNLYRAEEAKRLIDENRTLSLLELAQRAGYGSISSLSRSFKDVHKVSLSAYRK